MSQASAVPEFRYRAFISYSHQDQSWARWLHKSLETWAVPKRLVGRRTAAGSIPRRLRPIFRDRDDLASATDLSRSVNEALQQSANLIVICSPGAAASHWVNEEVLAFKRLGRSQRIFCLIVAGEPNASDLAGRQAEECFAPSLRRLADAAGNLTDQATEPVAADVRPGQDGKSNALLKLIAGLLELDFDQLRQRELQRRLRRLVAVAAAALGVMLVTTTLAITAVVARHAAERRQNQAEDLVDFMLGDLTTRLRQVDRLDILQSVYDKALAYFKSLPVDDLNETALAQRATALQKIGDVRTDQNRLPDALEAFEQALLLNGQLVADHPDDPKRQSAYGENLLWIGYTYWNQGDLARAEEYFQQATASLQRATALAPADEDVQEHLAEAYTDLGHVAEARGELEPAHDQYLAYLDLSRRMATQFPDKPVWRSFVADAYTNLGTIALARGQLAEAIQAYRDNQHLMADVTARDPHDRQLQSQLLSGDAILGRTLALAGDAESGSKYVDGAVSIAAGLVAFDPSHADWQDAYAYYSRLQGQLRLEQGDVEAARAPTGTGVTVLLALVANDPSNTRWQSNLAEAQLQAARLASTVKQTGEARKLALQASASMRKLLAAEPTADSHRIEAAIELLLGQFAADAADTDGASRYRQQALARMQPLAQSSADPRNLVIWVEALLAVGDVERASPAIRSLQQMGYRSARFVARLREHGIDYPENPAFRARIAQIMGATNPASAGPLREPSPAAQ